MSGITELETLLKEMAPQLHGGEYCFLSIPGADYGDCSFLNPVASIQEKEGLTLVVPRSAALEHGYPCKRSFRLLSLEVHSSLNGVGLTAAVSKKLAGKGISANVIAGFYHDHILVPAVHAEEALQLLQEMGGE